MEHRMPITPLQCHRSDQLQRRDDDSLPVPVPHCPTAMLHIRGRISRPALERAVAAIAERQQALRTRLSLNGPVPCQVIGSDRLQMSTIEPPGATPGERRALAERLQDELSRAEFGPGRPMCDVALLPIADDEAMLLLRSDQLVSDLWSMNVIVGDLGRAYSAEIGLSTWPSPLPLSYAQAVEEDLAWLDSHAGLAARERCGRLATAARQVALPAPTSLARPAPRFAARNWSLRDRAFQALVRACQDANGTLAAAVLAALGAAAAARLGCDAIPVLVVLPGRDRPETQPLVMWRSTMLPVPVRADSGLAFGEMMRDVQRASFLALADQRVPWPVVARDHGLEDRPDGRPPVEMSFHYIPAALTARDAAQAFRGMDATPVLGAPCLTGAAFDMLVSQDTHEVVGRLQFREDLVTADFADSVIADMLTLLSGGALPWRSL
jgi:hypothetical protein